MTTARVVLFQGRWLTLVRHHGWEFVERRRATGVVAIAARTVDDALVLVRQHRPALGAPVVELPAGLVGDEPGQEDESSREAAQRELHEETGFRGGVWHRIHEGPVSSGHTTEVVTLWAADGVRRDGPGGGVDGEDIEVLTIPLATAIPWITARQRAGEFVDPKVLLAALWLTAHSDA